MNARERGLVEYYDRTLNYYSPVSAEALAWFDIDWPASGWVLDLGCGDGRLAEFLPPVGKIVGLDGSAGRIADAHRRWPDNDWRVRDLYDPLPCHPGGWPLICMFEVLEHLANPVLVLSAARRILRPGGRLIGSVPINSPGERHLQVFETTKDVAERLSPTAMHAYGRHVLLEWDNELKADSCPPTGSEAAEPARVNVVMHGRGEFRKLPKAADPNPQSQILNPKLNEPMAPGPGAGPTAVANAHRAPVSPPNCVEGD